MTNILQKIVPRPVKIPKSQKMLAFPSFVERCRKSMVTRKVNDQLEATASPEATPFVSGVKSSATSIHGIGPNPRLNTMINRPSEQSGSQPRLETSLVA